MYLVHFCTDGEIIASSTNVDALFEHDFFLVVNDTRYLVKVAKEGIVVKVLNLSLTVVLHCVQHLN